MYTVCDIIEKLILIEKDCASMYNNISCRVKPSDPMLSIMAKTLSKQEAKHAVFYEDLKDEISKKEAVEIDFFLYDKVAKLLYEFRSKMNLPELKNVRELIKYAYEFEKKNVALLLDIQGRLLLSLQDASKLTYEVISKTIEEERKHEDELKTYIAG